MDAAWALKLANGGPSMLWMLQRKSRNVHAILFDADNPEFEQRVLLLSDLHWDNTKCNRDLLRRHLDQAVQHDAPVLLIGDTFCLMQGAYDPRKNKSALRPEHQTDDYIDAVINTAADWFEPYAKHIAVVGQGNHESSILKRMETDVVDRFCDALRQRGGITQPGGYSGFVRFHFSIHRKRSSQTMFYMHGHGGGGGASRGTTHFAKYQQQANADIFVSGHVHQKECFPVRTAHLTNAHKIEQRNVHCVRLGTYKDEWLDGHGGWHVERGGGPRPLGGYWMNFKRLNKHIIRNFMETE